MPQLKQQLEECDSFYCFNPPVKDEGLQSLNGVMKDTEICITAVSEDKLAKEAESCDEEALRQKLRAKLRAKR